MASLDYILIVLYLTALLYLGLRRRLDSRTDAAELIVAGRRLTLPAFVASLVSTWYGGILGVGEFSYLHGLSTWLVFGLPYYIAAILFAVFLARRARESEVLTIPERLAAAYDNRTAGVGATVVFLMTIPAAYVLMLGVLCEILFGWPFWLGVLAGTLFSMGYVFLGGFRSVVRTDIFQFVLMFIGFAVLLIVLGWRFGGLEFLQARLPDTHLTWHGGNSAWYIATWYVIALATLIEPSFYQRCYAARTPAIARNGLFVSIGFWLVFDFLTTSCGLYARALLPELADPVASFPALALEVLPIGLLGLFALSLLATVMSTIDSYSFVAASTFGQDVMCRLLGGSQDRVMYYTRIGLLISTVLAVLFAVFFRSAIEIWYAFGSVGTPALLVPVFFAFVGRKRLSPSAALWSIAISGTLSLMWYLSQYVTVSGDYWLGLQPILVVSVVIHLGWAAERSGTVAN
jgi:SSS family solute:Na+ symporter